ncbi:MAG: response regulator transcription factor [Oligoflexales bacterium]
MIDKSDKSLLIIEDEPDLMEFYLLFIESEFKWKNLYSATNGNEAKHILKTKEVDVVISDYKLPDYDGLELLKKMHDKNVKIPKYIFITGYDSAKFRKAVMLLGVATILKKPLGDKALDELKKRLKIA